VAGYDAGSHMVGDVGWWAGLADVASSMVVE